MRFILLALLFVPFSYASTFVYVQETGGPITVYSASTAGKLTQIKGSPFPLPVGGSLLGISGTHLIILNNASLYSYEVSSDGAIGARVSEILPLNYSTCGPATTSLNGAVIDGAYLYVAVDGYQDGNLLPIPNCNWIQTYEVGSLLTYKGVTTSTYGTGGVLMPTLLDNKYAYTSYGGGGDLGRFYAEGTTGVLIQENSSIWNYPGGGTINQPAAGYAFEDFYGEFVADLNHHLAVGVQAETPEGASSLVTMLASYTVDSQGDITTTNPLENMPQLPGSPLSLIMAMNPQGTVLAVAIGTGTEFYHFNGAEPITAFTGVIGVSGFITTMAWDTSNHLYALNGATGKLHVYDATTTGVKEVSDSPYQPPFKSSYYPRIVVSSR
jgi:hypothetical protein